MLAIKINTVEGQVVLDTHSDLVIVTKHKHPFMDHNLDEGVWSFPFEVPITDRNATVFSHKDPTIDLVNNTTITGEVWEDGEMIYSNVRFNLIGVQGIFNDKVGTYTLSISGGESGFYKEIRNKKLSNLNLGGAIDMEMPGRKFANEVSKGTITKYNNILDFAPIRNQHYIDESRADYSSELLINNVLNNIVYNSTTSQWSFGVPSAAVPNVPAEPGEGEYLNQRTVPFFKLKYVLSSIFSEHGYSIGGDLMEMEELDNVFIFNNYSLESYRYSAKDDINTFIVPKNHMPNTSITAALGAILATFGCGLFYLGNKQFITISYKNLRRSSKVIDITKGVDGAYETIENEWNEGIEMEWMWDDMDSLPGDRVKDIAPSDIKYSKLTESQLNAAVPSPVPQHGDIALAIAENKYLRWDNGEGKFLYYADRQQAKKIGDGEASLQPHLSPMLQASGVTEDMNNYYLPMVETAQPGNYETYGRIRVYNDVDLRLFYIGRRDFDVYSEVPFTFVNDKDNLNNRLSNLALSWEGSSGIYEKLLREWYDLLINSYFLKVKVFNSVITPDELLYNKVMIAGNEYIVLEMEYRAGDNESYITIVRNQNVLA